MRPRQARLAAVICVGVVIAPPLAARPAARQPAAAPPRIAVCSLLTKDEVRRHLPWPAALDGIPVEEEAIGATGSSCNYPSVHVQMLPYSAGFVEAARKSGPLAAVAGLGDEAWFRNNRGEYAEVFVKVGARLLTLQADAGDDIATVTPRVIALARAAVTKLR